MTTDQIVDKLREFRATPRDAFWKTDARDYSVLRSGYIDQNLNLTPAAYRLLHNHPKGMTNEYSWAVR